MTCHIRYKNYVILHNPITFEVDLIFDKVFDGSNNFFLISR